MIVRLSPFEKFLNFLPNTNLYIRGEKGADYQKRAKLEKELQDVLAPWLTNLTKEHERRGREEFEDWVKRNYSFVYTEWVKDNESTTN